MTMPRSIHSLRGSLALALAWLANVAWVIILSGLWLLGGLLYLARGGPRRRWNKEERK